MGCSSGYNNDKYPITNKQKAQFCNFASCHFGFEAFAALKLTHNIYLFK
jgi:hypothetical protein